MLFRFINLKLEYQMSKKRNRSATKNVSNRKEYNTIRLKYIVEDFCPICSRRAGRMMKCAGTPKSRKSIRSWKKYRKTQWRGSSVG